MIKFVKILKVSLLILFIVACIYLIKYLLPIFTKLSTVSGQNEFKTIISNLGILGILMLFGLQLAQMFLFIIPGEPIEILAGMCYGGIGGTIFILLSTLIITTLIVVITNKYGRIFIYQFFDKNKVDKILDNKFFNDTKRIELIMFILFFIPGTPKDLLVFIGSLLPINKLRFIMIATFARFPSVISSTLAGSNLAYGNVLTSIIIYAISFLLVGIVIIIINIFDKNNTTKEVIKNIRR